MPKLGSLQNLQRELGIFVIICGICRGVDKKQVPKKHNWPKTMLKLHKIKACNKKCLKSKTGLPVIWWLWRVLMQEENVSAEWADGCQDCIVDANGNTAPLAGDEVDVLLPFIL